MTAQTLHRTPVQERRYLSYLVGVSALAVIIFGFNCFFRYLSAASAESSQSVWSSSVFFSGLLAGCFYAFASFVTGMEDYKRPSPISTLCRKAAAYTGVSSFSVWLFSLALFPLLTLIVVEFKPYVLDVPPGHMRIMNDGRLLLTGDSTIGQRYRATSTLVALSRETSLLTPVKTPIGTVTVRTRLRFTLDPQNVAFLSFASIHAQKIALGKTFIAEEIERRHVAPAASRMVSEIQSGMSSGSSAAMIVRMGQIIHIEQPRTPWLQSIAIDAVEVDNWSNRYN